MILNSLFLTSSMERVQFCIENCMYRCVQVRRHSLEAVLFFDPISMLCFLDVLHVKTF